MGAEIPPASILYPVFAMFALVFAALMRMRSLRFAAVRLGELDAEFHRSFSAGAEPEPLRVIGRHFGNLFEMPVLFSVGVLLAYVTQQVNLWSVARAWVSVALRYAHGSVHLSSNRVMTRFAVYFASGLVLLVLWASLLVQLLRAGSRADFLREART